MELSSAPGGAGTPGGRSRRRRTPRREFYSIGEVCAMLDLRPHVLRYWETQFAELAPPKNRAGNRLYRARDVELIALIRRLVHEEKYTIAGARERIAEMRQAGEATQNATRALEVAFLRSLRDELEDVLEILEVPGSDVVGSQEPDVSSTTRRATED